MRACNLAVLTVSQVICEEAGRGRERGGCESTRDREKEATEDGGSRPSLHSRNTTAVLVLTANCAVFAGSQVRLLRTQSSGPETLRMVGGTANLQIVDLQAEMQASR
jgi:hypothetical protein